MTGEWPEIDIDHKNRDKADNRWMNLRSATKTQNMWNTAAPRHNKSGSKGVYYSGHHKKWVASLWSRNKHISFGYFETIEEARDAYAKGALRVCGEFARTE